MTSSLVDAVRSPIRHAGPGDAIARLSKLQAEFAEVLGVSRVFVRNQGIEHFITAQSDDTLDHARDDPRSGEARYDWLDRGDGVLYGYLKNEPRRS